MIKALTLLFILFGGLMGWVERGHTQSADADPLPSVEADPLPSVEDVHLQIDLMWINRSLNPDATFLFPGEQVAVGKEYITPLIKWAILNPTSSSKIYVWYDSSTTSDAVVEYTQKRLDRLITAKKDQGLKLCAIEFKDIRALPFLKNNPKRNAFFSNPRIPIYAKTDLLRLIVLLDQEPKDPEARDRIYRLYTDFTVAPMNREALFDPHTLRLLDKFGIVMAQDDKFSYENYFYIIDPSNKKMMNTLRHCLVEPVMEQIEYLIDKPYKPEVHGVRYILDNHKDFGQIVWDMHNKYFFKCLHHALGYESLSVTNIGHVKITFEPGNPINHDDPDFSSGLLGLGSHSLMALAENDLNKKGLWYPTKKVERNRPSRHDAFARLPQG